MFNTNRGLLKFILLSFITFGIYGIVVMSHISEEINILARPRDGKHTMHFLLIALIFSWLTLGIAVVVWYHRLSNRIGDELDARACGYSFSAADFWLWNVLGSIIFVGPFIYQYKMFKAMNLVNAAYLANNR